MRYKSLGRNREYRLTVPRLTGGLNVQSHPTLVADNELTQMCNLCQKDGALTTRTGLRLKGDGPFTALPVSGEQVLSSTDIILTKPIEVDGEMCSVVIGGVVYEGNANTQFSVQLLTLDGDVKREYAVWDLVSGGDIAVLPCDQTKYGSPFLLFKNNSVYKETLNENGVWTLSVLPEEELYAPLVMINAQSIPMKEATENGYRANGVMYEGYNMLSGYYRSQFTSACDGIDGAEYYVLPTGIRAHTSVTVDVVADGINESFTVGVKGKKESVTASIKLAGTNDYEVTVNQAGWIGIRPPLPKSTVSGNITITCQREDFDDTISGGVSGATLATWFGGTQNRLGGTRAFLSGFRKDGAKICWSDINNPLYFPENNYMYVGDLSQPITALEKQEDMLVVFKKREMFYTTYVQGEIDETSVLQGTNVDVTVIQAYFPLTQLSPHIGCDCPGSIAVCQNRLVWMCSDGRLYALASASPYNECNVREIGMKITPHIAANTTITQRTQASAADVDGQYMLFIGNQAYSFHYGDTGFSYLSSSYTSDKISSGIAWYYHRYDALPTLGRPTVSVISDGADRALVVVTQKQVGAYYTHVRFAYVFDGEEDRAAGAAVQPEIDDNGQVTTQLITYVKTAPIVSSFTTKTFDFGDIAAFKRIKALFLSAAGARIGLRLVADGQSALSAKYIASGRQDMHRVWCSIGRCKTLAITAESEGAMTVSSIRLHYTPLGTVK